MPQARRGLGQHVGDATGLDLCRAIEMPDQHSPDRRAQGDRDGIPDLQVLCCGRTSETPVIRETLKPGALMHGQWTGFHRMT